MIADLIYLALFIPSRDVSLLSLNWPGKLQCKRSHHRTRFGRRFFRQL